MHLKTMFNFDPQHLFHLDCLIQFSALNQSTIPCTCIDMTVVLEGIFTNISSTPLIKHTAALYWPMQLMLGYLMITISQWSYLIAVIISSSNPYKTTNLDMFYHGILGIFWMSKYFFENFWGNYIFIFTTFQNSKFQTFSLAIIDWPNHIFIRNKQIKSFLKYLLCIYIENQSTKMFLLWYQLQVCTYN